MERFISTTPKNEVELRLICVKIAMDTTVTNPANKLNETIDGAQKILNFVTKDDTLTVDMVSNVMDSVMPYIAQIIESLKDDEPEKPKKEKKPKIEKVEDIKPDENKE